MTAYPEEFEGLCADVHAWWMQAARAHGRESAPSRHGTGELMRPYTDLAEIDREDDRRAVRAVLNGLAKLPPHVVTALVVTSPTDRELLAQIREAAQAADPPLADLVDRCADLATGEDSQR